MKYTNQKLQIPVILQRSASFIHCKLACPFPAPRRDALSLSTPRRDALSSSTPRRDALFLSYLRHCDILHPLNQAARATTSSCSAPRHALHLISPRTICNLFKEYMVYNVAQPYLGIFNSHTTRQIAIPPKYEILQISRLS